MEEKWISLVCKVQSGQAKVSPKNHNPVLAAILIYNAGCKASRELPGLARGIRCISLLIGANSQIPHRDKADREENFFIVNLSYLLNP